MVSISACRAEDPGSIPVGGVCFVYVRTADIKDFPIADYHVDDRSLPNRLCDGMNLREQLLDSAVGHTFSKMRMPGIEPRSQAWEACMMPLHYMHRVRIPDPSIRHCSTTAATHEDA